MERSIYRIIDANFNRGREGLRVIEEYCRFYLNNSQLSGRAKQLRHLLCDAVSKIDPAKLITSRDTTGDVGVGQKIEKQLQRKDLSDTLTAACKRVPEALRAISEMAQTFDPGLAEKIEMIRYQSYTLEKDIISYCIPFEKFKNSKLYVLITSNDLAEVEKLTQQCVRGGADCIQLRAKGLEDNPFLELALKFVKICKDNNVISIINDRVDIAIVSGADGVHLGQNDLPVDEARHLMLKPMIIGLSTHNIEELEKACQLNPTYIAIGPAFATNTKPNIKVAGLKYIKQAIKILEDKGIANVAIGGINIENIEQLLELGVKTVAVCSAVTDNSDPEARCRVLKNMIDTHL
ncbi:MAG TPA: thiamine phosphate synthase [Sedimentisphaerales bacterium]|nr:thiamine phosphate synthase [Sedimentisphaerales bacterium]